MKEPRYYQRIAINRAVEAIIGGDGRLLITMATGTGKTFVAMQVVWKLWQAKWREVRNPRVLYLADRNILIDQPIEREFKPAFGPGDDSPIWKLRGSAKAGREIYFALYQQLADAGDDPTGMFRDFRRDFFDLVIVDECHRCSARAESSWRAILDYFQPATQLGMTATPKRDETADTYGYFGDPLYEYTLAEGISDGFLAPYRVRRVVLSADAFGWSPSEGELDRFGREIPDGLYWIVSEEGQIGHGHLSDFADVEKDTPVIATTSQLLSTGVDLPTVRNIVLLRPVGSIALFKQMIGRGTRLYPDEDKLSFDIIDYSGATALFNDPEFDGLPERVLRRRSTIWAR